MKNFVFGLIGLFMLVGLTVMGLTLTGHLVVVPEHQTINYVDENHKVLFSADGGLIYYRIAFVK